MLSSIDRLVIESKLGLSQVGFYVVAVQLVAVMGLMLDSINNAYVPWLFEKLKRDNITEKRQIVRYTYIYCFILLLIAALSFLIGPIILQLMIGEQYEIAGELVGWLALGQAFNGMYLMVTNYIFFSRRTGLLSLATITSGIVNFSLLLTLTSLFGLKGAAISFATSMAFKFLLTWFIANLRHPMPWFNFSEST
jgi:O-antigen/teichoic acid export membrane protein